MTGTEQLSRNLAACRNQLYDCYIQLLRHLSLACIRYMSMHRISAQQLCRIWYVWLRLLNVVTWLPNTSKKNSMQQYRNHTRENSLLAVQLTRPPVLSTGSLHDDLYTIAGLEWQISIGLCFEIIQRDYIYRRRCCWLRFGLERRWWWWGPFGCWAWTAIAETVRRRCTVGCTPEWWRGWRRFLGERGGIRTSTIWRS